MDTEIENIKDRINAFLLKEEKPDENNEREET